MYRRWLLLVICFHSLAGFSIDLSRLPPVAIVPLHQPLAWCRAHLVTRDTFLTLSPTRNRIALSSLSGAFPTRVIRDWGPSSTAIDHHSELLDTVGGSSVAANGNYFAYDNVYLRDGLDSRRAIGLWRINTAAPLLLDPVSTRDPASMRLKCRFSWDSSKLACADTPGRLSIYDVTESLRTGMTVSLGRFRPHQGREFEIHWTSDSRYLFTSPKWGDDPLKRWDLNTTAAEAITVETYPLPRRSGLALLPDGRRAFFAHEGAITLYDFVLGRSLYSFRAHPHTVWDIAVSPDGHSLVSSGYDRTCFSAEHEDLRLCDFSVHVWNAATGAHRFTLRRSSGFEGWVGDFAFSHDSRAITATGAQHIFWHLP